MKIATWNVRSFLAEEKKVQLVRELERYRVEIGVLTEIRYAGSGVQMIRPNWTMLFSGAEKQGRNGLGIVLSPQAKRAWEETGGQWEAINDRMIQARFRISSGRCLTVIGVYAPTELADEKVSEQFYRQLQKVKEKVPSRDIIVIAGDFNARVGRENDGIEKVMGRCGLKEKKNGNGERLIHFATINEMRIASTYYRHERQHLGTWKEFGNETIHQIDHVLIQQRWARCVEDVRVFRGANCNSDHFLLVAKMKWKFYFSKRKEQQGSWKFRQLNQKQRQQYAKEVNKGIKEATRTADETEQQAESKWRRIQTAVKEGMQRAMQEIRVIKKNDWISDATLELIEQQREIRKGWLQGHPTCSKEEWKELKKKIKKSVKMDKKKCWEERANKMEEAQRQGKARELFEEVGRMRGKRKGGVERIQDKKGEIKSDTAQVAECITDYFQRLFNVDAKADADMMVPVVEVKADQWKDLDVEPTQEEVAAKIKQLKNGKAGGPDDITAEGIKWACEGEDKTLLNEIHQLIKEIWRTGDVPKEWGEAVMVPLLKKGDPTLCDNYRGIALLSICGKVLTRIIADRIQHGYKDQMMEAQCGFRGGRSTTDQMFTLRQVVERRREYGLRSYVAFVDLKKAYDSVPRRLLFKVLRAEGIPEVMVRILESLYSRTTGRVRVKGMLGPEFELRTGVRQGCVISPLLFNIYLNHILKRAERELEAKGLHFSYHIGREVGPTETRDPAKRKPLRLWGTLYADDIALLAASRDHLQEMLSKVNEEFSRYGMTISAEKTKVMLCKEDETETEKTVPLNINIGSEKIEEVQSFKYVGGIITANGEMREEIEQRIKAAGMAFGGLRRQLFGDKKMAISVKLKIYDSLILAILLYGSETWNVRAEETRKLETFHMNCLRCMSGRSKREKIRNVVIRKMLKQTTIQSMMRRRRLRWLGHVRRMSDERWPKQMMHAWIEDETRPRWKPKQRWRDVVNKDLEELGLKDRWFEMAAQREEWRSAIQKKEQARFEEAERKEEARIKEFKCPSCEMKCKSHRGLIIHMEKKHPNVCEKCGKEFKSATGLVLHRRACGNEDKRREKEEADEESEWATWNKQKRRSRKNPTAQSTTEEKSPPACSSSSLPPDPCSLPTASSTKEEEEEEEEAIQCPLCAQEFSANRGLSSHLRHKHNISFSSLSSTSHPPASVSPSSVICSSVCSSLSSSSSAPPPCSIATPTVSLTPLTPTPPSEQANTKQQQCPYCEHLSADSRGLSSHLRFKHKAEYQKSKTSTSSSTKTTSTQPLSSVSSPLSDKGSFIPPRSSWSEPMT